MGAIIGSACSSLHSTSMKFDLGIFKHLRQSNHKRDFVTAGVAAGVAAAFDAPIGGLLFSFEDVASFWQVDLGWQIFFACTVAVLTQMLCQSADRAIRHEGDFGFFNNNVEFEVGVTVYNHVLSIIPAATIGILCGLLAVIYTQLNLAIDVFRCVCSQPTHKAV
jgi:chloride channel 7